MVRTVNEEPCIICRRVTNNYSPNYGRVCPEDEGVLIERFVGHELIGSDLKNHPLIDHSNDIDRGRSKITAQAEKLPE